MGNKILCFSEGATLSGEELNELYKMGLNKEIPSPFHVAVLIRSLETALVAFTVPLDIPNITKVNCLDILFFNEIQFYVSQKHYRCMLLFCIQLDASNRLLRFLVHHSYITS